MDSILSHKPQFPHHEAQIAWQEEMGNATFLVNKLLKLDGAGAGDLQVKAQRGMTGMLITSS